MGAGSSQEAPYDLKASVKAGTYRFVLDCIVITSVDTTFELMHRRGSDDTVLVTWSQHFDPLPEGFDAQTYELDQQAPAIDFTPGDQLVFRYSGSNTTTAMAFIPNGDGELAEGRIPNITFPR